METTPSKELSKTRKPYTITKQREKWTNEEHNKFLEAVGLYGRAWQRIHEHVGTKTAVQIRSHAQKFFLKLQKGVGGHPHGIIEIPSPRPKRKPSHPSDEVRVTNSSETWAWPSSAESVIMDAKGKKKIPKKEGASAHNGKNSASYPLPGYLTMIEASIAASLLATPFVDFSAPSCASINVGEAGDEHGNISSTISAITAATIEAAAAWWRLNGLFSSPLQSSISSVTQAMALNPPTKASKESTKWQSFASSSSSSSPKTVEYILASIVEGINEADEQAPSVRQIRNAGRFSKTYNDRPKQGPFAFEALFSRKVLPQSFGPLLPMDDGDGKLNLNLWEEEEEEEAVGLQIDLNRKIFTENVCDSFDEEKS